MPAHEHSTTLHLIRTYQETRDKKALEALFRRCYPLALRIVELRLRRRLRGNREAEDIVQESLLDVFQGLDHFAMASEGEFKNWLAKIVENNVRDHFRHARAAKRGGGRVAHFADVPSASLRDLIARSPSPGAELGASELEARIEHALMDVLEDPHREVLILRKLCELSYEEIAKAMGYASKSSVRSLYTRALRKLRDCL